MLLSVAVALALSTQVAAPVDDLRLAVRAMDARDYPTAVRHFRAALKTNPKSTRILSSLGFCLAGAGEFQKAAEQFRELVKLEPGVASHHYNLGLALLNANAGEEAEAAFRRVLTLSPRNARAKAQLANALLEQARSGNTSKMKAAASAYREALPGNPGDPELRFNYAFTLARTGDEEGALSAYREVVRLAPDFPQAHLFLGITLFRLGNWDEALASLKAAAARGVDDFGLRYYLGSTLLKKLDYKAAQTYLESAARLNPEHPGVHFQLASLYRAQDQKERATAEQHAFRELSARQESKWRADALEQAAGRAIKEGDLGQGIAALSLAFESRPDAALARNLALAHLQQGDSAKAQSFLDKALELAPQDAATYNYLGLLAARGADLPLAARHFNRAAELDPNFVDALYNAGVAAFELKRYDKAVERFKAALAKSDDPKIREALAMVLADAGRYEESQREFEAAQRQRAGAGGTR